MTKKSSRVRNLLKKHRLSGVNKPKRTPSHPKKSHIVLAKSGDTTKLIRFGEQGASTAGKPKKGESDRMKQKRKSFKARHAKNIAKGKLSAAFWSNKQKWSTGGWVGGPVQLPILKLGGMPYKKKKKNRRGRPVRAKAQLGGFNFNSFIDQLNTLPALTSALGQTSHLNAGFNAQSGNAANMLGLMFSGLQNNQADPRTDRVLTESRGFFGFKNGGSPGMAIDVKVTLPSKKKKSKGRTKLNRMLKKYQKKVNEARMEVREARKEITNEAAAQLFNQSAFRTNARDVVPRDGKKFKRQLGGGVSAPLRNINAIPPVGLNGNEGGSLMGIMPPQFIDPTAFESPLVPSAQQTQQRRQQQLLNQLLQQPLGAQLGAAVGPAALQQQIQAPQMKPLPTQLAGIPVNPLGLLQEEGPVVVPSRQLTFANIDAPTIVVPIPGMNAVVEVPIATTSIEREGDESSSKKKSKKRRKKKRNPIECGFPKTGPHMKRNEYFDQKLA